MPPAEPKVRRETIWPVLLAATITVCSGFPAAVPEVRWIEADKVGHFALYGVLATTLLRHPGLARWPWPGAWWAVPLASLYGLGDEFRQSLTHGIRSFDLADWAADTAGAVVAGVLYRRWAGYRHLLETPVFGKRGKARVEISPEPLPNHTA
jgi:VanZ family protein